MAFVEDFSEFLDTTTGFAVAATYDVDGSATTLNGIFDNGYLLQLGGDVGIDSADPTFLCAVADLPYNQVPYSEDFTKWAGTATVSSSNSDTAPDDTLTADTLEDSGATLEYLTTPVVTVADSETWTASVYIKKDTTPKATRFPCLRIFFSGVSTTGIDVTLDTTTGETYGKLYTGTGTYVDSGAVSGNGYYRLWVTGTNNATGNTDGRPWIYPAFGASASLATESSAATGTIVAWGAMFEKASTLGDYRPAYGISPELVAPNNARGRTLQIHNKIYTIKDIEADGTGMVLLQLHG